MKKINQIIAIAGPTATGKSDLAVEIAQKINGEIISADSRQVYRGLDIGSGKITKKEMGGIPHYMIDVVSPKRVFSVFEYKKKSEKVLEKIWQKGKTPILVGGTGQYIESIINNVTFPEVPPNTELRKKLEKKSLKQLQSQLKKLDPKRYRDIDIHNPVRLIRAIEIAKSIGKVPRIKREKSKFDLLIIGLDTKDLEERIHTRLYRRIKMGMLREVRRLHEKGLSWKRMESLGLEYRYLSQYLKGKISKKEMLEKLETEIRKYAKRQRTWFKKDKRIRWFDVKDKKKAIELVKKFVS